MRGCTGRWRPAAIPLLFVALLSACESGFEPFAEAEQIFTLLGYLDTDADTQFVRVVPIRQVVQRPEPGPIDAWVKTTDLTADRVVVWQDSLVRFADGTYGHVYWATFRAEPGHTYRLEVRRSDGKTARAETTVPQRPGSAETVYGALNENIQYAPLFWPGVENVIAVDVQYDVNLKPGGLIPPPDPPPSTATRVHIPYPQHRRGTHEGGVWRVDFFLSEQKKEVVEALRRDGRMGSDILLYSLRMRIATPSADWQPPGDVWDPEVLVQPGTFSNVEGGFGFWGSVARTTVEWQLAPITMYALGYYPYFNPDTE